TKDDICSEGTPTTPLLIITFKNFNNPLFSKSVDSLTVSTIVENDTIHLVKSTTTDSIAIPLRTGFDYTDYLFVENDQNDNPGNTDKIKFNYQRESVYINRACAFKLIYNQLSADRETDSDNWIQEITVNKLTVENENETHVTIYH
ncbi:MAG: hypothetical protein IMY67_02630, partial [Bacteroidetes bacterium]|nr:hypothetical protein [Bacteroidota bacterium]